MEHHTPDTRDVPSVPPWDDPNPGRRPQPHPVELPTETVGQCDGCGRHTWLYSGICGDCGHEMTEFMADEWARVTGDDRYC